MKRNACQKCAFAVRDDNPHCGLRGFTTSFNVEWCSAENDKVPNGYELQEDGYFSWVKKKKEYPKTYEECAKIMNCPIAGPSGWLFNFDANIKDPYYRKIDILMGKFTRLLICRDAYWKIAGDEMGLGKPWKPDWYDEKQDRHGFYNEVKYTIINPTTLVFPTAKIRDAFYENFKEEIESCKELL